MPRTYTNVEEVLVCIKVTLKGELSSILDTSVSRGSDYESQGRGYESHCRQELFILCLFVFNKFLTGRLRPYK